MNKEVIANQLISMRSQIDANLHNIERNEEINPTYYQLSSMRSQIDAMLYYLAEGDAPPECEHKNKLDMTTMGGKTKWTCKDCGYKFGIEE